MPFYRDPATILPQGIQQVLAMIGMRDPRAAMPGMGMMTVGPKAIPLDRPQQYIREVLGETIGDMAQRSRVAPGAASDSEMALFNKMYTSVGSEPAMVKSWMDPRLAENARRGFKIPVGDDAAAQEMSAGLEDRLVTWLANLFYGR